MMLVVVIGVFLTTEIPLLVITVLHTLNNRSEQQRPLKTSFHVGGTDLPISGYNLL